LSSITSHVNIVNQLLEETIFSFRAVPDCTNRLCV
jgi:hypothetical protein